MENKIPLNEMAFASGDPTDLSSYYLRSLENQFPQNESKSLMEEVMQEVEKISKVSNVERNGSIKIKDDNTTGKESSDLELDSNSRMREKSSIISSSSDANLNKNKLTYSVPSQERLSSNKTTFQKHYVSSSDALTMHAESGTSGYFSDSASEDLESLHQKKRQIRSKTVSPVRRIFKPQKHYDMESGKEASSKEETPKRESIYSKLFKAAKRDHSSCRSSKEPIYTKIKSKLNAESTFKPIEPVTSVHSSTVSKIIVKPEPLYNKIRRLTRTPDTDASNELKSKSTWLQKSTSPTPNESMSESFSNGNKKYKEKSRSQVLESLYSKIKKKETNKIPIVNQLDRINQPIFQQPLPAIPYDIKDDDGNFNSKNAGTSTNLVVVKSKEMPEIIPCKPSLITISNPGYANISSFSSSSTMNTCPSNNLLTPEYFDHQSSGEKPNDILQESPNSLNLMTGDNEDTFNSTMESENKSNSNNINNDKSLRLDALVEELYNDLERAARDSEFTKPGSYFNKELLRQMLSAYDVPKSLRSVQSQEIMDFHEEELRFVDDDEDNMETIYADIPDYSHDEFVIALDDENNPIYPTFALGMRNTEQRADSPGKVSRKSAQVYTNAINVLAALKVLINSNSSKAALVINRMGSLAKPYTQRVHSSIAENNTWIKRRFYHRSGHGGFDELRRYIKSGGEFCKELAIIMHERAEMEVCYAKGLQKLSTKLMKASRDALGSVTEAWQAVGAEMEHEADIHRLLASSVTEEVVRPLRQLIETQHKIRKSVEGMVDKATKNLHDWKIAEFKSKKNSYHNTRENEKVQDMAIEARLGRGKQYSEKEILKLEKQRKKAEEAVQKSDIEYYNFCVRTERARQEWESAVYKGSNCFQTLEEDRLSSLKDLVLNYYKLSKEAAPKLVAVSNRLDEPVAACNVEKDIQTVVLAKATGENKPQQYLPDLYSEDFNNSMNKVRRKETLENFLKIVHSDLDRELKGKRGVENLSKALLESPNFGGQESQQDVSDKLQGMKAMLLYLDVTRHKIQVALDQLNNQNRPTHPLEENIEVQRDKQGYPVSVLKIPSNLSMSNHEYLNSNNSRTEADADSELVWGERGRADGYSGQPESDYDCQSKAVPLTQINSRANASLNFMHPFQYPSLTFALDEFSSQDSDHEYRTTVDGIDWDSHHNQRVPQTDPYNGNLTTVNHIPAENGNGVEDGTYYARPLTTTSALGHCKALYDYDANIYDELSIQTGDVISIHEKQPDGWWVGELNGNIGIFPATYVQEID